MKKVVSLLLGSLLVVSLLFSVTSSAEAFFVEPPSLPDPYVTPVSGDMEFTTELPARSQLPRCPGLQQMLVPIGFPSVKPSFSTPA